MLSCVIVQIGEGCELNVMMAVHLEKDIVLHTINHRPCGVYRQKCKLTIGCATRTCAAYSKLPMYPCMMCNL